MNVLPPRIFISKFEFSISHSHIYNISNSLQIGSDNQNFTSKRAAELMKRFLHSVFSDIKIHLQLLIKRLSFFPPSPSDSNLISPRYVDTSIDFLQFHDNNFLALAFLSWKRYSVWCELTFDSSKHEKFSAFSSKLCCSRKIRSDMRGNGN